MIPKELDHEDRVTLWTIGLCLVMAQRGLFNHPVLSLRPECIGMIKELNESGFKPTKEELLEAMIEVTSEAYKRLAEVGGGKG